MSELEEHVVALVWERKVDPLQAQLATTSQGAKGGHVEQLFTSGPIQPR